MFDKIHCCAKKTIASAVFSAESAPASKRAKEILTESRHTFIDTRLLPESRRCTVARFLAALFSSIVEGDYK
jgi:hypothetical protein